jgi:hypothetical protein
MQLSNESCLRSSVNDESIPAPVLRDSCPFLPALDDGLLVKGGLGR